MKSEDYFTIATKTLCIIFNQLVDTWGYRNLLICMYPVYNFFFPCRKYTKYFFPIKISYDVKKTEKKINTTEILPDYLSTVHIQISVTNTHKDCGSLCDKDFILCFLGIQFVVHLSYFNIAIIFNLQIKSI